jgi:hypothetical protein
LLEFDFLGLVKEEFDGIGFGLFVDLFFKENFFLGTSWEFNLPRDCFKFSMDLRGADFTREKVGAFSDEFFEGRDVGYMRF